MALKFMTKSEKIILQNLAVIAGYASGLAQGVAYEGFNKEALIKSLNEISQLAKDASVEAWKGVA